MLGSSKSKSGSTGQASSQEHVAERKIDVKLYTLYADHSDLRLRRDLYMEAHELPIRFADKPSAYLNFLRKWGRYVPIDVSLGGSLVIDMKFTSSSSAQDSYEGVETALDAICSGGFFGADVSGSASYQAGHDSSASASALMADSKISLLANGGDPQIASAITDFAPNTHNTATFRGDIQAWLR